MQTFCLPEARGKASNTGALPPRSQERVLSASEGARAWNSTPRGPSPALRMRDLGEQPPRSRRFSLDLDVPEEGDRRLQHAAHVLPPGGRLIVLTGRQIGHEVIELELQFLDDLLLLLEVGRAGEGIAQLLDTLVLRPAEP